MLGSKICVVSSSTKRDQTPPKTSQYCPAGCSSYSSGELEGDSTSQEEVYTALKAGYWDYAVMVTPYCNCP